MRPLIILPGWSHGRESWELVIPNFSPREVHVIEMPGFGDEPLVSSEWGVPEYAAWTKEKLAPFAPGGFDLLGHSFGGRLAALLASEGVPGLHTLTLYGAPVLYRPQAGVQARSFAAKMLKPALSPFISASALIGGELKDAEERGMGAIFRKTVTFDQTDTLGEIRVPTLLLWGEKDEAVRGEIAREAHVLIKGSELLFLPGLGHNAHYENPTLFAGAVGRFLLTHDDPPTLH